MSIEETIRQVVRQEIADQLEPIKKLVKPYGDFPPALTPVEARKILRIGKDNMYQLLQFRKERGFYPAHKITDKKYIIATSALFKWLDENPEYKENVDLHADISSKEVS